MNGFLPHSRGFRHGLYEVHLPVTDVDRAIDFYVEKLGVELGFGGSGGPSANFFSPMRTHAGCSG